MTTFWATARKKLFVFSRSEKIREEKGDKFQFIIEADTLRGSKKFFLESFFIHPGEYTFIISELGFEESGVPKWRSIVIRGRVVGSDPAENKIEIDIKKEVETFTRDEPDPESLLRLFGYIK